MKMKVLIMMGSDSDLPVMDETAKVLGEFGIPFRMTVASAHRTPERTLRIIREAEKNGAEVIVSGAGMAAHLPGVIASHTILPVIGVPLDASPLHGMDALLSIVQMPPGIPVATVSVGKAGARNAGILACQIMARKDAALKKKLTEHRKKMAREVDEKAARVEKK
ncbi:MAG TPA: 5-(carboxyamino)imidazole ribonucleotide mutase [Thermodesulfovibrionales bacterium]|nr:5-(carboxyamino)imidazole ribonucleotide mutase [Thermodesulfovibrionales bacterium]